MLWRRILSLVLQHKVCNMAEDISGMAGRGDAEIQK